MLKQCGRVACGRFRLAEYKFSSNGQYLYFVCNLKLTWMRCFGFTKSVKRCKNKCKIIYCYNHRFQWWTILGIFLTLIGLYQAILLLFPEKNKNREVIKMFKEKKATIDSQFLKINKTANFFLNDSQFNESAKAEVRKILAKSDSLKESFHNLSEKYISNLKDEMPVLIHNTHTEIHQLSKRFGMQIDSTHFYWDTTHMNDTSKSILKKLKFTLPSEYRLVLEAVYGCRDSVAIRQIERVNSRKRISNRLKRRTGNR